MVPSPPHVVEIWANEACSVRPVIGNEYTELYVQINDVINAACPNDPRYNSAEGISIATCHEEVEIGQPVFMYYAIDFSTVMIESYIEGQVLNYEEGVYKVTAESPVVFTSDNLIHIGPTL